MVHGMIICPTPPCKGTAVQLCSSNYTRETEAQTCPPTYTLYCTAITSVLLVLPCFVHSFFKRFLHLPLRKQCLIAQVTKGKDQVHLKSMTENKQASKSKESWLQARLQYFR